MNLRKITSLTAMLAFAIMLLTSIILYIVPQGRVAYWADWHLWGLDKTQWGANHIHTGFLFLHSIGLHTYYNWKSIVAYLKNKAKEVKIFTPNFNAAVVVTLVVVLGTLFQLPPFSTILGISEGIKDAAAVKYGEPPYGHAELSNLKSFTQTMGLEYDASLQQLKSTGFSIPDPKAPLKEIAKVNKVAPQRLFVEMQKAAPPKPAGEALRMPETPAPGLGKRQLAEVLKSYGLKPSAIVNQLAAKGLQVDPAATMKEAAAQNNVSPHDIYDAIRALQ